MIPGALVRVLYELIHRILHPSTWLALAVLALPLGSRSGADGMLVTPSDTLLLVAIGAAAVELLRAGRLEVIRSIPALAFLAMGLTSTVVAMLAPDIRLGLLGAVRSMELFCLVPLSVMVAWKTRWDAWLVLGSVLVLAVFEGTVGIIQRVTRTGALIDGEPIRAVGTFGAYNIAALAALCGIGMVIALACGVSLTGRGRRFGYALAAYLAVPLLLSLSRGAWIAAVVASFLVITRGRPTRIVAASAAAGIAAAVLLPPLIESGSGLGQRVESLLSATSDPDQSVKDRLALWGAARNMALDHPLTGVGPRAFPQHRDSYADLTLLGSSDIGDAQGFRRVALESPHNFYLLIASEQGLIALTVYGTALATLLARGLVRVARPIGGASTAAALAGTGMLGYQLVDMVSGDLGGPGSVMVALTLGAAGWAAADQPLQVDYRLFDWARVEGVR